MQVCIQRKKTHFQKPIRKTHDTGQECRRDLPSSLRNSDPRIATSWRARASNLNMPLARISESWAVFSVHVHIIENHTLHEWQGDAITIFTFFIFCKPCNLTLLCIIHRKKYAAANFAQMLITFEIPKISSNLTMHVLF